MGKALLFLFIWRISGNPIIAILILLVLFYFVDQKYIGIFPNLLKPIRYGQRMSQLKKDLRDNPHYTSAKVELANLLLKKKRYNQALHYLEQVVHNMGDSAEVFCEIGYCQLNLGRLEEGERSILKALNINSRVKYGEPYLKLGEVFATVQLDKAISYLEQFHKTNSSSCEGFYRLGVLYQKIGRKEMAKKAYEEAIAIYRSLPRYRRRAERKWAFLSWMKRRP